VGVKDTREMRRHLDVFVKNEIISEDDIQPLPSNQRFYPKLSDIRMWLKRFSIGKHLAQRTSSTSVHMERPLQGKVIRRRISKPFYSSIKLHGSVDAWKDMAMK